MNLRHPVEKLGPVARSLCGLSPTPALPTRGREKKRESLHFVAGEKKREGLPLVVGEKKGRT